MIPVYPTENIKNNYPLIKPALHCLSQFFHAAKSSYTYENRSQKILPGFIKHAAFVFNKNAGSKLHR
jgi:hypothetical protein